MSLWTPGGEHPVGREPRPSQPPAGEPAPGPQPTSSGPPPASGDDDPLAGMSPEERQQAEDMAREMAEVRRQLSEVPAAVVVANHAMGLYELAAIHLSSEPPKLEEAQLAIDGLGALVEGLAGRLGQSEPTLRDALSQLRLAFVQIRAGTGGGAARSGPSGG